MKFKHLTKNMAQLFVVNFFVNLTVKGWLLWKETKFNLNTSFRIRMLLIWKSGGWHSGQDLYSANKVVKKKKPSQKVTLATVQWFSGTKLISGTVRNSVSFFFWLLREFLKYIQSCSAFQLSKFGHLHQKDLWKPSNRFSAYTEQFSSVRAVRELLIHMLDSPLQIVQHIEHYLCTWHPSPISWSLYAGSTNRTHFHGGFYRKHIAVFMKVQLNNAV